MDGPKSPTSEGQIILVGVMKAIPVFILAPRFILSLRQLYARDVQSRRGADIDTAFGLTSVSIYGDLGSAVVLTDAGQHERLEQDSEGIPLEEWQARL